MLHDILFLFPHTPAKSKFFLPLVFTKMLLSAKGIRKKSILTSGGNKECRKSQAKRPRLCLEHQFMCDFEHSLFFLPWLVIYYYHRIIVVPRILIVKMHDQDEAFHSCKEMEKWPKIFHCYFFQDQKVHPLQILQNFPIYPEYHAQFFVSIQL